MCDLLGQLGQQRGAEQAGGNGVHAHLAMKCVRSMLVNKKKKKEHLEAKGFYPD